MTQAHVLLFAALAQKFGFNMLNTDFDNTNMEETVRFIVSIIVKNFFETAGTSTRDAIAKVFSTILENCFTGDKSYGPGNSKLAKDLFIHPLFGAI